MLCLQEEKQAATRQEHAAQIRAQIASREEAAKIAKAAKMAEGAKLRAQIAEHKALIEVWHQSAALNAETVACEAKAGLMA